LVVRQLAKIRLSHPKNRVFPMKEKIEKNYLEFLIRLRLLTPIQQCNPTDSVQCKGGALPHIGGFRELLHNWGH
jgi:hypothetical protein